MELNYQNKKSLSKVIHFGMAASCLLFIVGCAEQNQTIDKNESLTEKTEDYTKEVFSPKEFAGWVQGKESTLKKEQIVGSFVFSALYKPHEYIICMEERNENLADTTLKRKVAEIEEMEYYDLKIELTNGKNEILKYELESPQQYTNRVNYYAFGMQRDIKLVVDGKDSISCDLYHFERAYDVVPFVKIVIGFKKVDTYKEKTLVFNDNVFGAGDIKLRFTKKELRNVPKLKTI
ncbi:MAG: hypothetical protein RLZ10_3072 [Bacteroidota bacterium]|jgi:hypothetical protein